jgi:hypothetical protein
MMRRFLPLAAALAISGCTTSPPPPSARLPADAVTGAGDPVRAAVSNTSDVFANQRRLDGRPAEAAIAIAQMEYMATEMPINPRFTNASTTLPIQFNQARVEWRGVLGIPMSIPAQAVINALYACARALNNGQQAAAIAALSPSIFQPGGDATLQRLGDLPRLRATNQAAVAARDVFERHQGMGSGRY